MDNHEFNSGQTPTFNFHNKLVAVLINIGGLIPYFELFINRRSQMFMIQLMVSNIIDEHCDYHFKDVRKIFKERVKEQLILAGAGNLADESVLNYIGPRPKLADDPLFANLKKDEEKTENE